MDGIANVAKQQQTQVNVTETQGRVVEQTKQAESQSQQKNLVEESRNDSMSPTNSINTEDQVKDLVSNLNKALEPMNTSLKFGVDSQDVFYVSVIDTTTNKTIRRFPAEQAQDFLPKMQEVTGILFDYKG